jgi:hypothetical protein
MQRAGVECRVSTGKGMIMELSPVKQVPSITQGPSYELGELLGVTGDSENWGRVLAFCLALVAEDLVWTVVNVARGGYSGSLMNVASSFSVALLRNVLLTVVVLGAFRRIRNGMLAAPVAALAFSLLVLPPKLVAHLSTRYLDSVEGWRNIATVELVNVIGTAAFLLGLVLALRWLKPTWLALLAGSIAGTLIALAARAALTGTGGSFSHWLVLCAWWLTGRLVFAGAFWGALQTPWARLGEAPEAPTPDHHRVSKAFFLGSAAVALGLALPLAYDGYVAATMHRESAMTLLALSWIPNLYLVVVMPVLFYKMWAAIQDGHARATPGKAIGFLFIPLFNLYWVFQLVWGWAKDYNRLVERQGLHAPRMPEGLFLAYVILALTTWIPGLGLVLASVSYLVFLAMVERICNGINALPPDLRPAP